MQRVATRSPGPQSLCLLDVRFCILLIRFNENNVFQLLTAVCMEVIKTVEKIHPTCKLKTNCAYLPHLK